MASVARHHEADGRVAPADSAVPRLLAPTRDAIGVASLITVHVGLVVLLALTLNVWVDDAFTLETTDHGIAVAAERAVRFELQPPGYFVSLAAWRAIDDSVFFARLFSILCTTATLFVALHLGRRIAPRIPSTAVVSFVALNPLVVWAAVEIRCYAGVLLISSLLLLWFHDGWLRPKRATTSRVLYVLGAVVGVYWFYYLGFLLVAAAAVLIVERRWRDLGTYVAAMMVVAVCLLPLAQIVPGQFDQHHSAEEDAGVSIVAAVKTVIWRIEELLLPLQRVAGATFARWTWRLVLLGACGLFFAHRAFRRGSVLAALVLLATTAAPFVLLSLVDPKSTSELRHTSPPFLPATLLVLAVANAASRRTVIVAAVLVTVTNVVVLAREYAPLAKQGDWHRLSRALEPRVAEDEAIVVFSAAQAIAFERHYDGPGRVLPIPRPEDFERYDPREYALTTPEAIDAAILAAGCRLDRVHLVRAGGRAVFGIDFRPEVVDRWASENHEEHDHRVFEGSELVTLTRRSTPHTNPPTESAPSETGEPRHTTSSD